WYRAFHAPNIPPCRDAIDRVSHPKETQCIASLQKKQSKHTSSVQRGEVGIPRSVQMYLRMFLFNIRRGETSFAQTSFAQSLRANDHLRAKYFLPLRYCYYVSCVC